MAKEAKDALALLDHTGLARAAILGSFCGGFLGPVIAATARHRTPGLCLNDVGPVVGRDGLMRISAYVGVGPAVPTLEDVADRMPSARPGFWHVPVLRWQEGTIRHFVQLDGRVGLTYGRALQLALDAAMADPLPALWPLFDAWEGLPLALIRGAASAVLAATSAREQRCCRPHLILIKFPGRGHIPFLDEPAAMGALIAWLCAV